jgi:hypothetical protein
VEAANHVGRETMGGGARSPQVGRERHRETEWLGLWRPGSWAPKYQDRFGPRQI